MKFCLFSFYYPPDLSAGSFRSVSLINALKKQLEVNDHLVVITTSPNRYKSYEASNENLSTTTNPKIYRINIPQHTGSMLSQASVFFVYFIKAIRICYREKPDFLIGTSGRLMTAILTWVSSKIVRKPYAIDLRDIFSETISNMFSKKNILLGKLLNIVFSYFDKKVLYNAKSVNIVSKGFLSYFQDKGFNTSDWLFYPNGVDDIFLNIYKSENPRAKSIKKILYAGNIGYAQALDKIIPSVAKKIGEEYSFIIIGDGSAKKRLVQSLYQEKIKNVEIINPVSRQDLIKYYNKCDILFLHLDDLPAFKRVLPSKLFEYASIGKPIVAGLDGYSKDFADKHISYVSTFMPGKVDDCVKCILDSNQMVIEKNNVDTFLSNFSRETLMTSYAKDLINIAKD